MMHVSTKERNVMKKRNLWKMFLLEIVTLGIYRLYFLIKTRREMMDLNPNIKIKSPWFLIAPGLIVGIAFIALMISIFATTSSAQHCLASTNSQSNYSFSSEQTSTPSCASKGNPASLLAFFAIYPLILIAIILFIVWEWSYSHGVEAITGNRLSFALSLIILLVVPDGIDILIIQDYFNKIGESPVSPANYATPASPLPPATTAVPPAAPIV